MWGGGPATDEHSRKQMMFLSACAAFPQGSATLCPITRKNPFCLSWGVVEDVFRLCPLVCMIMTPTAQSVFLCAQFPSAVFCKTPRVPSGPSTLQSPSASLCTALSSLSSVKIPIGLMGPAGHPALTLGLWPLSMQNRLRACTGDRLHRLRPILRILVLFQKQPLAASVRLVSSFLSARPGTPGGPKAAALVSLSCWPFSDCFHFSGLGCFGSPPPLHSKLVPFFRHHAGLDSCGGSLGKDLGPVLPLLDIPLPPWGSQTGPDFKFGCPNCPVSIVGSGAGRGCWFLGPLCTPFLSSLLLLSGRPNPLLCVDSAISWEILPDQIP